MNEVGFQGSKLHPIWLQIMQTLKQADIGLDAAKTVLQKCAEDFPKVTRSGGFRLPESTKD